MKKKLLYIGIAVIALVGGLAAYSYPHTTLAKCPDDFGTDDAGSAQYTASVNAWTNAYFDAHPDATMSDWAEARHQFYIENNCTASLQRYEDAKSGNADPKAMERVDAVIRDELDTHSQ